MGLVREDTFTCFDCETTGLDPGKDQIIEIAAVKFTFSSTLEEKETLIDPGIPIPENTIEIHHITDDMVIGKPKIETVLADFLDFIGNHTLVGHAITFDIAIVNAAARKHGLKTHLEKHTFIDTLRLARLYGESPTNSLDTLGKHFDVERWGAHRAMNDVRVNIAVFKRLAEKFKTTEEILTRLKKPIALRNMPLGKHKGRLFRDIPIEYLRWASHQDFDNDLLFSLRSELKKRKRGNLFSQASNPFQEL